MKAGERHKWRQVILLCLQPQPLPSSKSELAGGLQCTLHTPVFVFVFEFVFVFVLSNVFVFAFVFVFVVLNVFVFVGLQSNNPASGLRK